MADDAGNEPADSSAVMARFLRIYRYLNRYSRAIAREFGISGRQLSALRYLSKCGRATIGELSDYLYVSDSSTSELVDKLQERGLVLRTRCTKDSRVVRVSLTPQGESLVACAPLAGISLMRQRLESLPDQELASLAHALELLANLLGVDEIPLRSE